MPKARLIFEQILKMRYYRNYAATSGAVHNISKHEDAVRDVLVFHGLSEVTQKVTRKQRDLWLSNPSKCSLPDNSFVFQPCGHNDSPDFIMKVDGKSYFIECKSVKGSSKAPMYNSGIPKDEYIYVFTAERYDKTTVYKPVWNSTLYTPDD